jgi:hypothetical protein
MADEGHADGERIKLLGRVLSTIFEVRAYVIEPGCDRVYDAAEWRDALVEIEAGEVDLELCCGKAVRFTAGDVLWLCGLGLKALHNRGRAPVVLVALFRGPPDAGRATSNTVRDEKLDDCRLNMHDDNRARHKACE